MLGLCAAGAKDDSTIGESSFHRNAAPVAGYSCI